MITKKSTGKFDINNNEIFEGDTLFGETRDGEFANFVVRWSDYWKKFIGDNPYEIYDISEDIFNQYELIS